VGYGTAENPALPIATVIPVQSHRERGRYGAAMSRGDIRSGS
jgi:hypothetical protein